MPLNTPTKDKSPWLIVALISIGLLALLLTRIQFFINNYALDTDEINMMTMAVRLQSDWIPWRSINAGSSGPLTPAVLAVSHWLGLPLTYTATHILAFVFLSVIFLICWRISRRLTDSFSAITAFLACTFWTASFHHVGFIHFACELVPITLLVSGLWFLVEEDGTCTCAITKLLPGCFLTGLSPWGKLQVAPLALIICLWVAASIFLKPRGKCSPERKHLLIEIAIFGALLPTLLMLGICYLGGSLEDLWIIYFKTSLAYTNGIVHKGYLQGFIKLLAHPWNHGVLALGILALILSPACFIEKSYRWRTILCGVMLLSSGYAVLRSPWPREHYEIIMFVPIQLSVALAISMLRRSLQEAPKSLARKVLASCLLVGVGTPLALALNSTLPTYFELIKNPMAESNDQAKILRRVSPYIPLGSSLFVWGWSPCLYIDLQAKPVTRTADYLYLEMPSPGLQFMRDRCMQDLYITKPDFIIDIDTGNWFPVGTVKPFPKLQALLSQSYKAVYRDAQIIVYKRSPDKSTLKSDPTASHPLATPAPAPSK